MEQIFILQLAELEKQLHSYSMNIELPEHTEYQLKSLARLNEWEWWYATIEERDAVADRLIYSIMDVVLTKFLIIEKWTHLHSTSVKK